jgi:hypothetical protein
MEAALTFAPSSLQVNRGVAYDNGRVFRGAGPGHVIALDAATGTTAWDVELSPIQPGVTVPMAPVAWNGLVFVGNAGGDNYGVTGHVWALDQKDGHTVWRFDVVPESGPARDSWRNSAGVPITGGAFWTTFALDQQAGILFVPAGNPAPDFQPDARPATTCIRTPSSPSTRSQGSSSTTYSWSRRTTMTGTWMQGRSAHDARRAADRRVCQQGRTPVIDRSVADETALADADHHARKHRCAARARAPVRFCPGTTGGTSGTVRPSTGRSTCCSSARSTGAPR